MTVGDRMQLLATARHVTHFPQLYLLIVTVGDRMQLLATARYITHFPQLYLLIVTVGDRMQLPPPRCSRRLH